MKLLALVSEIKSDLGDLGINYAVLNLDDKAKQYLEERQVLFKAVRSIANDLNNMRFVGCSFITFYRDIDLRLIMGEDEEHILFENGYFELPDGLDISTNVEDAPHPQLVIGNNIWYVLAGYEGAEICTQPILFEDAK